eukprot:6643164-Pyramimonas_sp.AAC.1
MRGPRTSPIFGASQEGLEGTRGSSADAGTSVRRERERERERERGREREDAVCRRWPLARVRAVEPSEMPACIRV